MTNNDQSVWDAKDRRSYKLEIMRMIYGKSGEWSATSEVLADEMLAYIYRPFNKEEHERARKNAQQEVESQV